MTTTKLTIAVSLYAFGAEREYSEFAVTTEGLADAAALLGRRMAEGHSYRLSDWQFAGRSVDCLDARPLVIAGDVAGLTEFIRAHATQM